MLAKTHAVFGFLTGLFAIQLLHPSNQILFIAPVTAAALLPDIDHPDSKAGKYVKPIGFLFEHMGFFHSLFALILFPLLAYLFWQPIYAWAVLIGYGSHLIIDSITHIGIMPLHPLSRFRIRGFIKSGAAAEFAIFIGLVIISFWKLINL